MLQRLSFATKIFLTSALLVVLAVAAAAAITYTRGYQIARSAANDALAHSRAVQQSFQTLRFHQLQLMSRLLSNDSAFVSYVTEATGNSLSTNGQVDVSSIRDLLTERQSELGFDFGMLLGNDGQLIVSTENGTPANGDLSSNPVVAAAIHAQQSGTGYWLRGGHAYQVAIAPLANQDTLNGYLVLGLAVDTTLLQQVKQVSGAQLVVLDTAAGKYQPVAATLGAAQLQALMPALADNTPLPTGRIFPLTLNGGRWLAYADPLDQSAQSGIALTLTSLESAMGGFRAILAEQLLAASLAILVAIALSLWLSRRLVRPLRQLADAAQAAAHGDYQRRFEPKGEGEIAQLMQALDSLLSDLREQGEIENYLTDLAKYQPDPVAENLTPLSQAALAPSAMNAAVLAVELADDPAAGAAPNKAIGALNQALRHVEAPARALDGRVAAVAGKRVFVVFPGRGDGAEAGRALATAGHILPNAAAQRVSLRAAVAMGAIVTGSAEWTTGISECLVGPPVRELEQLLSDVPPGSIVVTPAVVAVCQQTNIKLQSVRGVLTGSNLLAAEPPPPAAASAAVEGATMAATVPMGAGSAAAALRIVPGLLLGGRYEILAELGAGGMGVVYKARDRELDEVVALKTLKAEAAHNSVLLEALKSEIRLARKITHRNILRTYDFGEVDGVPFISMEYMRGMTLRYLLQNRERLPFAAGLRIMRQVCTGLQVAHEQSVLHRDIKPENVMLEPSGNAKLMDFGIASPIKRGEGQGRETLVVGTPRYAAPEQLRGEAVDERADIYACGVMMYQMFTGKFPFTGKNVEQLIKEKTGGEYLPPTRHVEPFPAALAALIAACLKAERGQRPKSAAAMLEVLENIRV